MSDLHDSALQCFYYDDELGQLYLRKRVGRMARDEIPQDTFYFEKRTWSVCGMTYFLLNGTHLRDDKKLPVTQALLRKFFILLDDKLYWQIYINKGKLVDSLRTSDGRVRSAKPLRYFYLHGTWSRRRASVPLTQARLKELVHYDPLTGLFTRINSGSRFPTGERLGSPRGKGYLATTLDGRKWYMHRLAFIYMEGKEVWGENEHVDHINRIRDDNRWTNLRITTPSGNALNRTKRKGTVFNVMGIEVAKNGRYRARITIDGMRTDVGSFSQLWDAICARKSAEYKHELFLTV